MATAPSPPPPPEKPPLHNFPLTFLRWGAKNHHRLRRKSPTTSSSSSPPPRRHENSAAKPSDTESEKSCWNLRPRRPLPPPSPAEKAPMLSVERELAAASTAAEMEERLPKVTTGRVARGVEGEKRKLWIALSREEIEEDIYSFTGARPSRRPKKRPRNLQKQIDNVFPGLWLVGISPEAYRGLDLPPKS